MNDKKTTASKNETNTKSIKITDEATEKTPKSTEQTAIKVKSAPKAKGHATMTDVQKPKAGQAVAVSTQKKSKSTKKPSAIRKSQPTAQLRAGKKVQVISAPAARATAKAVSTKKADKPTYQEVTLGGATKEAVRPINIKSPEKNPSATVTTKTSLPLSKITPKKMQLSFFRKIHLRPTQIAGGITILLLAVFFGRVAIWEHFYIARMEGSERHTTSEIENDNQIIEEDEWSDERKDAYEVAADKPRFLSIPSIGVYRSPIMEVSVNSRGEMATPPYLYNVGWYTGSSLPGTNGVSIIDGHGGPYSNAIFENLPSLAVGAEIIIEMGDGRIFNYYVADVANKPIGEEANNYMTNAFRSPETGRGSLTLITCTGDWVVRDNIRTYSHRLFVRALLDPSQSAAAPAVTLPTVQIPQVIGTPSTRPNTNQPSTSTPNDPGNNNGSSNGDNDNNNGGENPPQPPTPDVPETPETPVPPANPEPENPPQPPTPDVPETPETPVPPANPEPEIPPETPPAETPAGGEENN